MVFYFYSQHKYLLENALEFLWRIFIFEDSAKQKSSVLTAS